MSSPSFRRSRLLLAFVLWIVPASVFADTVTLAWDPSDGATGYTVKWGTVLGSYPNSGDAGNNTTYNITGLVAGGTYFAVVQAYDGTNTSDFSTPLQFTVPLAACTFGVSPTGMSAPAAGASGSTTVTTQAGCAWSATSASSFLTLQNGTGRVGSGTVTFTVAANTTTSARTLTATIAGQPFTVSQAAQVCTYSITPTSSSAPDTGTSGSVTVTTQTGCAWSATSGNSFLTFQNGTGRTGSGTVTYTVAANTSTSTRTLSGTVAGQAFAVSQAAAPVQCSYSITPVSGSAPDTGGSGSVAVTTQTGCAWSATSGNSFLTFQNGTGRTGSGTVAYTVAANTTINARTLLGMVAGQTFTLSQAGQACSFSVSPTSASTTDAAASGILTVTAQAGCVWSATSGNSFLAFQNGTGRSGTGTVTYTVAANTTTSARTLTGTVAGQTFTVSQAGQACTYAVSPTSASATEAGSSGTLTVTAQAGCAWSATSGNSFLTFQNGTGRSGSGTVTYTVAANTTTSARTLTGTVAGQTFSVSQAGQGCSYSIAPATANVSDTATTGSVTVTAPAGCAWSATTSNNYLTFQNGTGRSGTGTVSYTVAANTTTSARTLTGTIAGQTFSVSQAAQPCSYSITPTTASVGDAAASGSLTVTAQAGCAWSATSGNSFLTFQNGTGRTGAGTVSYTVAANTTTSTRTLTGTVAGQTFTVSQAALACTYSINPSTISVSDAAASGTVTVTTPAGCAWSATSASSFLTFENGTGRSGPGSVTFNVAANITTSARTLTATVAGQTFTVPQAAPPQPCTYAINPSSANAPATGTTAAITVTTQDGCAWSASSASSFLSFPDGAGRSGSGTVNYSVIANPGAFRTGTATVAGKAFTLWQAAATSCTYSISPANVSTSAAASTGSITVTTQANCAWSATSTNGYLTFQNGTGRTGPGSVGYTIAENTGTTARNLSGLVAGQPFAASQAGTTVSEPGPASPWSSDFDRDGKNDLLVQDSIVGTVEAWFLNGATVKGTQPLSDSLDANWVVVGRGDFDVDGKPDLVWQHKTDGRVSLWYMDGTTKRSAVTLSNTQAWDAGWKVVGVGDFNTDGHPDLAWQHAATGALAAWLMDGSTVLSSPSFTPDRFTDPDWQVVGVGDFNSDGKSDLLWRHLGTGEMGAWLMNGLSRIIHSPLSPFSVPDQRWQVGAVMDANGDGKTDIVWHHTDGTIMIWHMNGTSRLTYPVVPPGLPAGWKLIGPK